MKRIKQGEEDNDGKLSINNSKILPVAQKYTYAIRPQYNKPISVGRKWTTLSSSYTICSNQETGFSACGYAYHDRSNGNWNFE